MASLELQRRLEDVVGGVRSIDNTSGFLVADACGRSLGHVECPMFGTSPDEPDALAVRSDGLFHHRFIVPAIAIDAIDPRTKVIGLGLERRQLHRFL
jgi:hypothetical protein